MYSFGDDIVIIRSSKSICYINIFISFE